MRIKLLIFPFLLVAMVCFALGCKKQQASTVSVDQMTFIELQGAAKAGNPKAQFRYGMLFDRDTATFAEKAEGMGWIRKAAVQGLPEAEFYLGYCYGYAQNVPLDYVESLKWLHLAADQTNSDAEFYVGLAYGKGQGVAKD